MREDGARTQDDARVGDGAGVRGGFPQESHGAVLCNLHVCYRCVFAGTEYYSK